MTTTEDTQRDELALTPDIIETAARALHADIRSTEDWDDASSIIIHEFKCYAHAALAAAVPLIARDPRKPRTIATVEELDALPEGSVVLDRNGLSLHKQNIIGTWNASNCTWNVLREELERDTFPATVLHEPEAEQAA